MAEIELGTLNNPEITLFLNAQDELEFQDSDGNVIATFKQDQSSEFDSVSTDEITNNSIIQLLQVFESWTDTIADDETVTVTPKPGNDGGIGILNNAGFNQDGAIFNAKHNGGSQGVYGQAITSGTNRVSFGEGGGNPDVDGNLNIFIDSGDIKVKNRTGNSTSPNIIWIIAQ